MALARLLAAVAAWLKLSASPPAKFMVRLLGRPVISATAEAVCAALVPWAVLPLPGVLTRNSNKSPTLRPPGARMLLGATAAFTTATVAEVVVGNVNLKFEGEKLKSQKIEVMLSFTAA